MILLARHAIAHRREWLWLVALATVGLGSGLLRLQLRTDGDMLRPVGDHFVESTRSDGLLFHDPRQVLLLVSARQGGPLLVSPRGFRFLAALQRDLRRLEPVRAAGILSAPALPRPVHGGGGFSLGTFFDDIPDQTDQFARLVAELRAQRVTTGLLLSRDGRYAAYYVPLVERGRVADLIDQLEGWLHARRDTDFYVRIGGPEMAEASLGRTVLRDLTVMVPVMLVMIITMLFIVLGNVGGVIITMAEALVVLIWTFGAMGWAGVPVTLVTTILPVVLMALSITDEMHLLERVQDNAAGMPDGRLADWVETALVEVGKPIIATSVTTALGLLSFVSASIVPIRQFGVFAAFGILVAMALSFTWIPALIVALPQWWFVPRVSRTRQRPLPVLGRWVMRRPFVALVWGLLIVAAGLPGLLRLRVQDAWVDNFASDAPLVTTERDYNDAFWGSYRFDIVVEGPPAFFYTPAGTDLTERLRRLAAQAPYVGGVLTHLAMLEGVAGALDQHGALSNLSPLMLADITIVAEMSENRLRLRQLLTTGGEATRVRLFVPDADYERAREIEAYLDDHLPALAEQHGVAYHYSGDLPTALATVDAIVGTQLRSVGWALLTVVLVLFVLFAPGKQALVCMTPVIAAVVVVFGGMGYAGMSLGIATSMFASLTIGVGVDFAIHLFYRYREESLAGRSHDSALEVTIDKAGRAVGWNALVLSLGFLVLGFSGLKPNHSLGLLLASAMAACYVATMLLLPCLLRVVGTGATATGLALAAVLMVTCTPCAFAAGPEGVVECTAAPDADATALMEKLERAFRGRRHIVRMVIRTAYGAAHPLREYAEAHPNEKILWGVFDGNLQETRLLYVFSGPGRLAGTTLIVTDYADPARDDAIWIYIRSLNSFNEIVPGTRRVMVPGTPLTYEDSRGFIPSDTYDFSFPASTSVEAEMEEADVLVLGCPKSAAVRERLGYSSLLVVVDKDKNMVRRVYYHDRGGKLLKTYELVEARESRAGWEASQIRMDHRTDGYSASIDLEHWYPDEGFPDEIYRAEATDEKFLPRLERVLAGAKLNKRLEEEIAAANETIRVYDRRMREMQEKRNEER